jgi:citrate lyase subunit beta/citryl-CoA lyase
MINFRSLLFIPGDSPKKLGKALGAGADVIILDLEDSVAPENKPLARDLVRDFLKENTPDKRSCKVMVRVNPLDSPQVHDDLIAVVQKGLDSVMLPKANGPEDVAKLSSYLDILERAEGMEHESISILPVATETSIAPFNLGRYAEASLNRLLGLTWGAEDLSAAIGASGNKDENGRLTHTYQMVRSACLLAAHAANVQAIETLYTDFRDDEGLRSSSRSARAEGFTGRIAIHPAQVKGINESFSPSEAEIEFAMKVVKAFEDNPGIGTVGLDGKMLDIPHFKQAQKVLEQAKAVQSVKKRQEIES